MKRSTWLGVIVLSILAVLFSIARNSAQADEGGYPLVRAENIDYVGHIGGGTYSLDVAGVTAYIGEGSSLTVIDLSLPGTPTVKGKTDALPGNVLDVFVESGIAYVAVGDAGLRIIDLSDPAHPVEISSYYVGDTTYSAYVYDGLAYVSTGWKGLRILDVSDPANPVEVGTLDSKVETVGACVQGRYAYVIDADFDYEYSYLRVVDVIDPSQTQVISQTMDTDVIYNDVFCQKGITYVADRLHLLRLYDVSDPYQARKVGEFFTEGKVHGIHIDDDTAYIANGYKGLVLLDVNDPANPVKISSLDTPGYAYDVKLSGKRAMVADGSMGLWEVDINDPQNPVESGRYMAPGYPLDVVMEGEVAYLADGSRGLWTVDVSDPADPRILARHDTPGSAQEIIVVDDSAYLADWYSGAVRYRVVDVSNPSTPLEIGHYTAPGYVYGYDVEDETLYLASGEDGLLVVDIHDPGGGEIIGRYTPPGLALRVDVQDDRLYLADNKGLRVIDVRDPGMPKLIGEYDHACWWDDVQALGGYAFGACGVDLMIFDFHDPSSPVLLNEITYQGEVEDIFIKNGLAYIITVVYDLWDLEQYSTLYAVDVRDLGDPVEIGYYHTPGTAKAVFGSGNYAYVADGTGGLLILESQNGTISGQVMDSRSGESISGVAVSAGDLIAATTDQDGNYAIMGLLPGTYTLTPTKQGYSFSPEIQTVTVLTDAKGIDFDGGQRLVVLVHDWPFTNEAWPEDYGCDLRITRYPESGYWLDAGGDGLPKWLHEAGFQVWFAHLDTDHSVEANASCLAEQIAQVSSRDLFGRVFLIGHGYGGVVARAYLESEDYARDAQMLFTLGGPHHGLSMDGMAFLNFDADLGNLCNPAGGSQPAWCDLTPLGMEIFNQQHPERALGVPYYLINGEASTDDLNALGLALRSLVSTSSDAWVTAESGLGTALSDIKERYQPAETHDDALGASAYYTSQDGVTSQSYSECIGPVMAGATVKCTSTLRNEIAEAVLSYPTTSIEAGTLVTGQVVTREVAISSSGVALFAAHWQTGTFSVTLVSPDDTRIDPAYAAEYPEEVSYWATEDTAVYEVTTAPGVWRLVLMAEDGILAEGVRYVNYVRMESMVDLHGQLDRYWYSPGATATLTATILTVPLTSTLEALLVTADGVTRTLALSPSVVGEYTGTFTIPDVPGYAEVRLKATGVYSGGLSFDRGDVLVFQISPETAILAGTYADQAVLLSPDSEYYGSLEVAVGVSLAISGSYGLSADLVDAEGAYVAHAFAVTVLEDCDPCDIPLRFDGEIIAAVGLDGPYTLTNLLLTDQNGPALVLQEAGEVYTTGYYDADQFGSRKVFLPMLWK
jgi:hypothetical protein